jgi:YD repeat-containing protein
MTCNSGIDSGIAEANRKTWCQSHTNINYPAQGASSVRPHAPIGIVGQNVTYDANGNALTYKVDGQQRTITYDGENRPVTIALGGGLTTTFAYGPDGERIQKALSASDQSWYLGGDVELTIAGGQQWTQYVHADVKREGNNVFSWLGKDHLSSNRLPAKAHRR